MMTQALTFSPIVAFDFAQHSAAGNLEALGRLASGLTSPMDLISRLAESMAALRRAHCDHLLGLLLKKLPKKTAVQMAGLLELPESDMLGMLVSASTVPEAWGLAYWATSCDHSPEGVSFKQLVKTFRGTAKGLEPQLAQTPLRLSYACPACAGEAQYDIHRFSLESKLLTFSMRCGACGHQEAYQRDGTWVSGQLSCSCVACMNRQREASAVHLPRVVIALEDAFRAAPGLASKSLHAVVNRIGTTNSALPHEGAQVKNPYIPTEWDGKHEVFLRPDKNDEPAPVHHFEATIKLGPFRGGQQDEVVLALASLGPTHSYCVEAKVREGDDASESFAYIPDCITLLLEGDSLAPSALLLEWARALQADGLLWDDRSKFERLVLKPLSRLTCEFSSVRLNEIEVRGDLVVRREVPKAETLLLSIGDALLEASESPSYIDLVVATGYASAPEHGQHILERARAIPEPEVQAVLQRLTHGQAVPADALKAAREALMHDGAAGALFYAALHWNYTKKVTGNNKKPLVPTRLTIFSDTIASAARERYSLHTAIACRRCSSKCASLTFWGANESQAIWRVHCKECGHWEQSYEYDYLSSQYCDCQRCVNAASVALQGKSTASLVSELISHCVVEAHALSSKHVGAIISEDEDLKDLLEGLQYDGERAGLVKCNADQAIWKPLRFNTPVGLLQHVLPGYSWDKPPLQTLALLAENRSSTMSRPVFQALLKFMKLVLNCYRAENLRFRLPLCVVLPDTIKEPKVPKRSARQP